MNGKRKCMPDSSQANNLNCDKHLKPIYTEFKGKRSLHFTSAQPITILTLKPTNSMFLPFPWFLHICSLLKTPRFKEKLLVTSNVSFAHVFYLFAELSAIFIKFEIVACKFFQFGRV